LVAVGVGHEVEGVLRVVAEEQGHAPKNNKNVIFFCFG
jgi:hypothetical protein